MAVQLLKIFEYVSGGPETKTLPGGRYFRLMKAAAVVDVEFFSETGASMGKAEGVLAGFAVSFEPHEIGLEAPLISFSSVKITSATAQTIQAAISRQRIDYDRSVGSVDVVIASTNPTTADVALGAAATTLIKAAAARKAIMITNLAANAASIRVGDSNAGAARGLELQPSQTLTLETTAAVYAYSVPAQSVSVLELI